MVRKKCNYLVASQVEAALKVVSANSKSDSITIELLSKELNKLEPEVVSDELDFLENTLQNQREEILRLENKVKEKEVEMEFFKKILVYVIERR